MDITPNQAVEREAIDWIIGVEGQAGRQKSPEGHPFQCDAVGMRLRRRLRRAELAVIGLQLSLLVVGGVLIFSGHRRGLALVGLSGLLAAVLAVRNTMRLSPPPSERDR